jgi:hypothetical protein
LADPVDIVREDVAADDGPIAGHASEGIAQAHLP